MSATFPSKSGPGLLLTAINAATADGVVLEFADISFSAPEPADQNGNTTTVTVTAEPDGKYSDSVAVFYNRVQMEDIFLGAGIEVIEVDIATLGGSSTSDVVASLNTRYGLEFAVEDIVDEAFDVGDGQVTIKAAPGSLGYTGQMMVNLVTAPLPLTDVIVSPELGDLEIPTPVPSV